MAKDESSAARGGRALRRQAGGLRRRPQRAGQAAEGGGERDRAAEVATWRRPTPIDWALNQVARDDADAIDRFTEAAAAAQEAQAAALSGRGEDLRAAVAGVRESSATVAALAAAALAGQGRPTASARAAVEHAAGRDRRRALAGRAARPRPVGCRCGGGRRRVRVRCGRGWADACARTARVGARRAAPGCSQSLARTPPRPASRRQQRRSVNASGPAPSRRPNGPTPSAQDALATATEALEQAEGELAALQTQLDRAQRARDKATAEHACVVAMRPMSRRRRWRRRANSERSQLINALRAFRR